MSNIKVTTNDYDIKMLEIETENRPVFISLNKAKEILRTNLDADLIEPVNFKGRDLFSITKENGGTFKVGEAKLNAVLDNAENIGAL